MNHSSPFSGSTRRQSSGAPAAAVPEISSISSSERAQSAPSSGIVAKHGGDGTTISTVPSPGLYRGQVVEARNPAMCRSGVRHTGAIKATLDQGMKALTGATDAVEAWKHFFEPGDVVGVKVVPNGQPEAHSSFEIVLEVIEKLKACGVKAKDMFVYDRYRSEFVDAGYHKVLPSD